MVRIEYHNVHLPNYNDANDHTNNIHCYAVSNTNRKKKCDHAVVCASL